MPQTFGEAFALLPAPAGRGIAPQRLIDAVGNCCSRYGFCTSRGAGLDRLMATEMSHGR